MKAWSRALSEELSSWPDVRVKPMFGMKAFYRRDRIFACLPHQRAFYSPKTVIFKFDRIPARLAEHAGKDPRINAESAFAKQGGWLSFEMSSGDDMRDALWWFNEAHRAARPATPRKRN